MLLCVPRTTRSARLQQPLHFLANRSTWWAIGKSYPAARKALPTPLDISRFDHSHKKLGRPCTTITSTLLDCVLSLGKSFAWLEDDIVVALTLTYNLIQALNTVDGSAGNYREAVIFL